MWFVCFASLLSPYFLFVLTFGFRYFLKTGSNMTVIMIVFLVLMERIFSDQRLVDYTGVTSSGAQAYVEVGLSILGF